MEIVVPGASVAFEMLMLLFYKEYIPKKGAYILSLNPPSFASDSTQQVNWKSKLNKQHWIYSYSEYSHLRALNAKVDSSHFIA